MAVPRDDSHTSRQGITYRASGDHNSTFGLILIHGWGCQKSDFDGVLAYILDNRIQRPDFRIICPDLPGHGLTSGSICPTASIANFAQTIITLICEIKLRDVVLVGHSMGVRIVSEVWRRNHEQEHQAFEIRGLVFIDGSDYRIRPTIAFDKSDPRSPNLSPDDVAALKAKVFQAMFSARTPKSFKSSTVAHVASREKGYSDALRDSMIKYDKEQISETMEALGKEGKTRLLNLQSSDARSGERIPLKIGQMSSWMEYLEQTVPHCTQTVVPDSAHFPHVDVPEVVGEEIMKLMKAVRS